MDQMVKTAIRKGIIPPAKDCLCFVCGTGRWENPNVRMEYHHVDHEKRLEVFPVCCKCHTAWHMAVTGKFSNQSKVASSRWEDPLQKEEQARRNSEREWSEESRAKNSRFAKSRTDLGRDDLGRFANPKKGIENDGA